MKKKYIVGIIIDNNRKVGMAIYDLNKRKVEIKSKQAVIEEHIKAKDIVGIEHKEQTLFQIKEQEFKNKNYPQLTRGAYNTRKLPVIDCEGNILIKGADVCIGTIGIGDSKKYIVVNTKGKLRFLNKEEVKKENLVGIIQGDKRINVIRDCQNIYMTMEEFERSRKDD